MTDSRFAITPMLVMALIGAPLPLGLMVWFVMIAPAFGGMLADFGAALPWVTELVLARAWGPAMLALYVLALPATLAFRSNVARDFALVAVVIAGLLAVMASAACLYLPLFLVAQQIR